MIKTAFKRFIIWMRSSEKSDPRMDVATMKRIKLFLGAYIDSVNAQDINCYNIAKYIDKNKFEVHALARTKDFRMPDVILHKVHSNRILKNIDKYIVMKNTNADLYYLPRVEKIDIFFAKNCKKNIVSSVEIQTVYEKKSYKKFFNAYITDYFCISNFLNDLNEKNWGKRVSVLYLGVSAQKEEVEHKALHTIAYVGSIVERKRPDLFLTLAKSFPALSFVMIGDGPLLQKIRQMAETEKILNITFKGRLGNTEVLEELKKCDLLIMTSKKEGLPKVVLEAASKSVPSVYINECYTIDYIENGINGYAVKSIDGMKRIISGLIQDRILYKALSEHAGQLADHYSWKQLITQYEDYFYRMAGKEHG